MVAALGACGTEDDERPATLEVVTLTVLAPNCGQVQCHSTTTRTKGLAFDTVEEARLTLIYELFIHTAVMGVDGTAVENDLMNPIRANGKERMPPDSPLADEDIALIQTWLNAGAPGLVQ